MNARGPTMKGHPRTSRGASPSPGSVLIVTHKPRIAPMNSLIGTIRRRMRRGATARMRGTDGLSWNQGVAGTIRVR